MCTVSFVSSNDKYIITSNRDEKVAREKAIEPKIHLVNDKKIFFPKDQKAGGTWYAVDDKAHIIVLLNGAKEKHELKFSYRKSRGLIVLDLISSESILLSWQEINLDNIEPFTLVVFEKQKLYQLQWNELEKEITELDTTKNHIWSSSTLYPKEIREQRSNWFYDFLESKNSISELDMLHFHKNTEDKNSENGLVINRNNLLKTLSITQTVIEKNKVSLTHYDLIENQEFANSFIVI
ncbi:NRDE family protein [Flavobacterium sp.]|uniref:NRDE family protein n=1 Tax=Flavobacterium sp. TaxID=239 RepID=UPI00374D8B6D